MWRLRWNGLTKISGGSASVAKILFHRDTETQRENQKGFCVSVTLRHQLFKSP